MYEKEALIVQLKTITSKYSLHCNLNKTDIYTQLFDKTKIDCSSLALVIYSDVEHFVYIIHCAT